MTRVVLVPGVLALLPEYAGREDPVVELRRAALEAVAWLGSEVTVLASEQGERVAAHLLEAAGVSRRALAGPPRPAVGPAPGGPPRPAEAYLVIGNGSAKRTEKAPGHLDERAADFDRALGESLWRGRPEVDADLARELWADVDAIVRMGELGELGEAQVDYVDDPYGVQYWVMRWSS